MLIEFIVIDFVLDVIINAWMYHHWFSAIVVSGLFTAVSIGIYKLACKYNIFNMGKKQLA
jgi:hypothetical protein